MKRKTITLILTFAQAKRLLLNLPEGHQITLSAEDANRIIDSGKKKGK